MSIINLYKYDFEHTVVINDDNFRTRNLPMNNKNIVVYKGATKRIYFLLKNYDGKPTTLDAATSTLHLLVHNKSNSSVVLKKELIKSTEAPAVPGSSRPSVRSDDPNAGKYYCDVNVGDIQNTNSGKYTWTVYDHVNDNNDISDIYIFSDIDNSVTGELEIRDGAVPVFVESTDLGNLSEWFEYLEIPTADPAFTSSALPSAAQKELREGMHSVSMIMDNYSGTVIAQGCLLTDPSTLEQDWFSINIGDTTDELIFLEHTGTTAVNFTVQCMWVRFRYQPTLDNAGEITKVLYRS